MNFGRGLYMTMPGVGDAEKRQALEAWGRRLEQIISGESADDKTVVPIRATQE